MTFFFRSDRQPEAARRGRSRLVDPNIEERAKKISVATCAFFSSQIGFPMFLELLRPYFLL
jgi:hypothetical protein